MQSIKLIKNITIVEGLNLSLNALFTHVNGVVKVKLNIPDEALKSKTLANHYTGYLDNNGVWQFKLDVIPGQQVWNNAEQELKKG